MSLDLRMTHSRLLIYTGLVLWASLLHHGACQAAGNPRPNIIVVLSDDMGFSDLGCFGSEIHTPNLDRLAGDGLRFTQFYNTARCCPTRACLLTGLYPHQAGVGHMIEDRGLEGYQGELNRRCVTIAEALKPAGYRTYAVGKWHVARNIKGDGPKTNWPLQRGFDRYYGTVTGAGSYFDPGTLTRDNTPVSPFADPEYKPGSFYYTDAITDHAVRFIADHKRDHRESPFFMYVAFTAAHWPLHAKALDIAKYKGRYDGGYESVRGARFEKQKRLGLIDPNGRLSPMWGDWSRVKNKAWEARCMEVYAAQIDSMDQGIGRIVAELQSQDLFDNTLILFLQDNGGCAEAIGRTGSMTRPEKPSLSPLSAEAIRTEGQPKQNRSGIPTLAGPNIMPGPEDTYISYGKAWANVSNTPFREYKHWVHEGGIATPLIVHWPACITVRGQICRQPGHLIDVMATCLDVAGATYPSEVHGNRTTPLEGRSLVPSFSGRAIEREALFWEHEGNRAIRAGRWKLVAKGPAGRWELYDMDKDRTEMNDLAARQPERVQELADRWETWARRAKVLPWIWKPPYGQATALGRSSNTGEGKSLQSDPGERPDSITDEWTLAGPLGETPKRISDSLPLSHWSGEGVWVKYEPMSDEFQGDSLDTDKWVRNMHWWKGRPPALFKAENVTVENGQLRLTMRKESISEEFRRQGYHDYTSAAVHSRDRTCYGYFEVKARPMNSGGSSSFWFQQDATPGWSTEIDVFEIGGKAPGHQNKYHMNLHVFRTPTEQRHRSIGGDWDAPWRLADDFHVYGLEWDEQSIQYYVDGVLVRRVRNTHWHQPLYLIFDSETMPDWFGIPDDKDLPSTFHIEYIRAWKRQGSTE